MTNHEEKIQILSLQMGVDATQAQTDLQNVSDKILNDMLKLTSTLKAYAQNSGREYGEGFLRGMKSQYSGFADFMADALRVAQQNLNLSGNAVYNRKDATLTNVTPVIDPVTRTPSPHYSQRTVYGATNLRDLSIDDIGGLIGNVTQTTRFPNPNTGTNDIDAVDQRNNIGGIGQFIQRSTEGINFIDITLDEAKNTIGKADKELNQFLDNYGDLLKRIRIGFDTTTGEAQSINANFKLSSTENAQMMLNRNDIRAINAGEATLHDWSAQHPSQVTRTYNNTAIDQEEAYKKLLTQERDIEAQIANANLKGNQTLSQRLGIQLQLVRAKKDALNQQRMEQTPQRGMLTDDTGNVDEQGTIANLNRELIRRNQNLGRISATDASQVAALREEANQRQQLMSLLERERQLRLQISGTASDTSRANELQAELGLVREQINGYSNLNNQFRQIVTDTRARNAAQQGERETLNELMTLEQQRHQAELNAQSASARGAEEERAIYAQQEQTYRTRYNDLYLIAEQTQSLTNVTRDALNEQININNAETQSINAMQKAIAKQREQEQAYTELSNDMKRYIELLKEQKQLENKGANNNNSIYGNSYDLVNTELETMRRNIIAMSDGIVTIGDNGTLQFNRMAQGVKLTQEQQTRLNALVDEYNLKIQNNANQAKEQQDLATIDKMIEAYTKLQQAQARLQQVKDNNYNSSAINRQQEVVNKANEEYRVLTAANPALVQSAEYTERLDRANQSLAANVSSTNTNIQAQVGFLARLKNNLARTAAMAFNYNIFNRVFMLMRQGLTDVIDKTKEFNKTMTEIQMVTNDTDEEVQGLLRSYSELAKQLGVTTSTVAEGSIEWLRQGKTAEETTKLLKASTMMATIGSMEASEATTKLTAILNSYKLGAEDAIGVVDALTDADLHAATSTAELATAFQYTASLAATSGVSLQKMIGMLTVSSETTRLSAETIGQSFKSMFSRLENIKVGKSIDDEGEAINDSEAVLKQYDIALRNSNNEFREMEDVLDELGGKWNTLTNVEQAQIATAVAGTRQRNIFSAMMENYADVLQYTENAYNSAGTAEQKYDHYLDGLEAKLNQLTVAWEEFVQGLNSTTSIFNVTGILSICVDVGQGLLTTLDALTNKVPVLQTLLTAFVAFKSIKFVTTAVLGIGKGFTTAVAGVKKFTTALKATNITTTISSFKNLTTGLSLYDKQQALTIITSKKIQTEQKKQQLATLGLNESQIALLLTSAEAQAAYLTSIGVTDQNTIAAINNIIATNGESNAWKEAKISQILFDAAVAQGTVVTEADTAAQAANIIEKQGQIAVNEALKVSTLALNIVLGAATLIISAVVSAVMSYSRAQEDNTKKTQESLQTYKDQKTTLEELKQSYIDLHKEMGKITLSSDDRASKSEELLTLQNKLIDTYGEQAKGIDLVNGNLEVQLQILRDIARENAQQTYDDKTNTEQRQKALDWNASANRNRRVSNESGGTTQIRGTNTEVKQEALEQMQQQGEQFSKVLETIFGDKVSDISANVQQLGSQNLTNMNLQMSYDLDFGNTSKLEYVDNLQEYISKINAQLETESNQAIIKYLNTVKNNLVTELDNITSTEDYKNYSDSISQWKDIVTAKSDSFTSTATGSSVDPQALISNYETRLDLMKQLALSGSDTIVDTITGQEVTFDKLWDLMAENSVDMDQYLNTLQGNDKKVVGDYINGLRDTFMDNKELISLKDYLLGNTEGIFTADDLLSDKEIEKLKSKTPTMIKAILSGKVNDNATKVILNKITDQLQDDFSIDELVNVLTSVGYVYSELGSLTPEEVLNNAPATEDEITNAVDTFTKLQDVIQQIQQGSMVDVAVIKELKDAGVDTSKLLTLTASNTAGFEEIEQAYLAKTTAGIKARNEEIEKVLNSTTEITDSEMQQLIAERQLNNLRISTLESTANKMNKISTDYISSLNSAKDLQIQLANFGDSKISAETLNEIVELYPEMARAIDKYNLGIITNNDLVTEFQKYYQEDYTNYINYQKNKYVESDEYYSQWLKDNSEWVEKFKNDYDIDLTRYANFTAAKLEIDSKFATRRKEILSNTEAISQYDDKDLSAYVDMQTGALTASGEYAVKNVNSAAEGALATDILGYQKAITGILPQVQQVYDDAQNAIDDLDHKKNKAVDNLVDNDLVDNTLEDKSQDFLDRINNSYSLLEELKENSSIITKDVLDGMVDAYAGMEEYRNKWLSGQISDSELISKFKDFYNADKKNYADYVVQKDHLVEQSLGSASLYQKMINKNKEWVDKFAKDYQIDLRNFTNLQIAKKAILEEVKNLELTDGFDLFQYVDEETGEYTDAYKAIFTGDHMPTDGYGWTYLADAYHDVFAKMTATTAEEVSDNIDKLLINTKYTIEDAISDISSYLSAQVDIYSKLIDGISAAAQIEIDALTKEKDLIEQKNEQQQRQIELQEKLEALNRAKTQRSVREYNAETGEFEWTTNKKDIENAQKDYDQALLDEKSNQLQDQIDTLQAYADSFTSVTDSVEKQRAMDEAIRTIADKYYKGDTSKVDLTNLTESQQNEIRSAFADSIARSADFDDMSTAIDTKKTMDKIVAAGYGSVDKTGSLIINPESIAKAMGVAFVNTQGNFDDILKSTSFAETKPLTSSATVNNITNTGAVTTNNTYTGDVYCQFDKNVDIDKMISEISTAFSMANGNTSIIK